MATNSQQIEDLARQKWHEAGCPESRSLEFWTQAEKELAYCPKCNTYKIDSLGYESMVTVCPKCAIVVICRNGVFWEANEKEYKTLSGLLLVSYRIAKGII